MNSAIQFSKAGWVSLSNFYKDIAMILYFPLFQTKGALQDFGVELNSTRSNLQDADVKLQKSLAAANSSLVEKVRRRIYISDWMLPPFFICKVSLMNISTW